MTVSGTELVASLDLSGFFLLGQGEGAGELLALLREEGIESDELYFRLGAKVMPLEGASLVAVPGLESLAAGCVVQEVEPEKIRGRKAAWLSEVEARVRGIGGSRCRVYLREDHPELSQAFAACGYQRREEIVYLSDNQVAGERDDLHFQRISTEADWLKKLDLYERHAAEKAVAGSDGYRHSAAAWVELMRQKSRNGKMEFYLVEREGSIVGALGLIESTHLLRLKNLLVDEQARGQAIGQAIVAWGRRQAELRGKIGAIVFGIRGTAGDRLYQRSGMRQIGSVIEWSKVL